MEVNDVRKLILTTGVLALGLMQAALAAEPHGGSLQQTELISAGLLDRAVLHSEAERVQRAAKRRAKHKAKPSRPSPKPDSPPVSVPPQLEAIAQCESGGNPQAVGGGGAYRGKYQFSTGAWAAVGGQGDPAAAPEAEQDRRAAMLYARSGAGQWPHCGA
jgi:hypothetical protein